MDSGVGFAFSPVKQVLSFRPWWHQLLWPALKERLGHGSRGAERMSGGGKNVGGKTAKKRNAEFRML